MRSKQGIKIALSVLRKSKEGVKMNLINFQLPNKIYINDASEYGVKGLAIHGCEWVYVILISLQERAHINLLEIIAEIISI